MASTSSSEIGRFSRFPGRFPSPTPSPSSSFDKVSPNSTPTTPLTRVKRTRSRTRSPFDYTAPDYNRQRPVFPVTQSEGSLQHKPTQQQRKRISYDAESLSPVTSTSRPSEKRRAVPDTRHDRFQPNTSSGHGFSTQPKTPIGQAATPIDLCNDTIFQASPSTNDSEYALSPIPDARPAFTTALEVHDGLDKKISKKLTTNYARGIVYIFSDPDRPTLLKIGHAMNCSDRKTQIRKKCKHRHDLGVVHKSVKLENYIRAEHLAHADLEHLCREYKCPGCGVDHHEWFEVSEERAKKTVDRWVNFIQQQQPYDGRGNLKTIWTSLMFKRQLLEPMNDTFDHDTRWDHWTQLLLPPSNLERCELVVEYLLSHPIWLHLWDSLWQVTAVLSLGITFVLSWNFVALGAFSFCFVCTLFSMSSVKPKSPRKSKPRSPRKSA